MFLGKYDRSLDEKGRLQLPSKLTGKLKPGMTYYWIKGFEGCLAFYEKKEFSCWLEDLRSRDWNDEANRAYIRLAAASASEVKVDSHGRILIPKEVLQDYVDGVEVTIIGALDHFELWDVKSYAHYVLTHASQYEALAKRR